ncbi:MAG: hypothetical protein REI11_04050, partial [Patulibacter sp.]|nr:hypothetical protein [Patulibacter sp.]
LRTIAPTTPPQIFDVDLASAEVSFTRSGLRADGAIVGSFGYGFPSFGLGTTAVDGWADHPTATGVTTIPASGTEGFTWFGLFSLGQLVTGVDGFDWGLAEDQRPEIVSGPATRLVALDDTGQVMRSVLLSSTVRPSTIVPTGRGVRVVAMSATAKVATSVLDERGHTLARIAGPIRYGDAAIGLPDGSVVLEGSGIPKRGASAVVRFRRVSASGRVTTWRPGFKVDAKAPWPTPLGATAHGVLYGTALDPFLDGGTPTLTLRTTDGHTFRRTAAELGVARSPDCITRGEGFQLQEFAGPSGPTVRLDCVFDAGRDYVPVQSTLIGLDDDLRVQWKRDIPNYFGAATESGGPAGDPIVGPNGTLLYGQEAIRGQQQFLDLYSAVVPKASPVYRGKVLGVARDEHGVPVVRIQCRHAEGRVCAGEADLLAGGRVVATARYGLLARLGTRAAVAARHIGVAGVKGKLGVRLRPLA